MVRSRFVLLVLAAALLVPALRWSAAAARHVLYGAPSGASALPGVAALRAEGAHGAAPTNAEAALASARSALASAPEHSKAQAAQAGPALEVTPVLSGRVVDEARRGVAAELIFTTEGTDDLPLELEAALRAHRPISALRGSAAADGAFRLPLSSPLEGRFYLTCLAPGFIPLRLERLPIDAAEAPTGTIDLGELRLRRGNALTGSVVDAGGAAVAGAQVGLAVVMGEQGIHASQPGSAIPLAVTDADGRFIARGLSDGPLTLVVDTPEHLRALQPVAAGSSARSLPPIVLQRGRRLEGRILGLEHAPRFSTEDLRVEARVGDPATSDHLAVADPLVACQGVRTSAVRGDGAFELNGLLSGHPYTLSVTRFAASLGYERIREVEPTVVSAEATQVELTLHPWLALELRVIDRETRRPVESFCIEGELRGAVALGSTRAEAPLPPLFDPVNGMTLRHPDGVALLDCLGTPPEDVIAHVKVFASGYEPGSFHSAPLEACPLSEQGRRQLGTLELTPAPPFSVRVVRQGSAEPVEGAEVLVATSLCGLDALAHLQDALYPISDERVLRGRTDVDGRVSFPRPMGATCSVAARAAHQRVVRAVSFIFDAAAEHELTVELASSGDLEVSAAWPGGAPATGAKVLLRPLPIQAPANKVDAGPSEGADQAAERPRTKRVDGAGRVRFIGLEPGMYEVALDDKVHTQVPTEVVWERVVVAPFATSRLALQARSVARLRGRVRASARPLAGALVSLEPPRGAALAELEAATDDLGLTRLRGQGGDCWSGWTHTQGDGSFELGHVAPGAWELLVATPRGALPEVIPIELREGLNELVIEVATASVRGRFVSQHGDPLSRVKLEVCDADDSIPWLEVEPLTWVAGPSGGLACQWGLPPSDAYVTGLDGDFMIEGLPVGRPLVLYDDGEWTDSDGTAVQPLAAGEVRDLGQVVRVHGARLAISAEPLPQLPLRLSVTRIGADSELYEIDYRLPEHLGCGNGCHLPLGDYHLELTDLSSGAVLASWTRTAQSEQLMHVDLCTR